MRVGIFGNIGIAELLCGIGGFGICLSLLQAAYGNYILSAILMYFGLVSLVGASKLHATHKPESFAQTGTSLDRG